MSGSFESVGWNARVHRLDLSLYSHLKEFYGMESESMLTPRGKNPLREAQKSWLVDCLTSQQHASVSWGRICTGKFTRCHTEIEVTDQTYYPTQSQYADTGPTSPSADPITPSTWQGSHWGASF